MMKVRVSVDEKFKNVINGFQSYIEEGKNIDDIRWKIKDKHDMPMQRIAGMLNLEIIEE